MHDLRFALILLGALLVPAAASAEPKPKPEPKPMPEAIRELLKLSCTGDYLEHCSMHAPGGPEVEACFRENIKKLTPPCAQAIKAYKRQKKTGLATRPAL